LAARHPTGSVARAFASNWPITARLTPVRSKWPQLRAQSDQLERLRPQCRALSLCHHPAAHRPAVPELAIGALIQSPRRQRL
jgi:hypothetical protein